MSSFHQYKLLRTKANTTDDTDYAAANPQTLPPAADRKKIQRPHAHRAESSVPIKVEWMVEWIVVATGAVVGGRGSFNARAVRIMSRSQSGDSIGGSGPVPASSVVADGTVCVVDEAPIAGVAYRPIVTADLMPGDDFYVELDTLVPVATATGCRILYRELP